jgi:membrane dipeptidase
MVARHADRFELALTADDAQRIEKAGKRVVYLSIENGYPIGKDLSLLQMFYDLGIRMVGPVHFANNDLGDSSTDPKGPEWHGLSPLGKQVVAEANRLGIVLDASHASDDVLDQMIALSRTPIVLSHSGCKAINDHPRNVDDERLRKLAAAGGVIQINSMYVIPVFKHPEYEKEVAALEARYGRMYALTPDKVAEFARERSALDEKYGVPRATFEDFERHLLHALKVVGPEHVGIGADWDGGGGVDGMSDIAAVPKITEVLLAAGYSEDDLQKIWGGNVLRVLRLAQEHQQRK